MVWSTVGTVASAQGWRDVGQFSSDLILVSFDMPAAPRPPLGVLRQKWDTNVYDGIWTKVFPKLVDRELIRIPVPPEFVEAGLVTRELQVRAWTPFPWTITVEEWL